MSEKFKLDVYKQDNTSVVRVDELQYTFTHQDINHFKTFADTAPSSDNLFNLSKEIFSLLKDNEQALNPSTKLLGQHVLQHISLVKKLLHDIFYLSDNHPFDPQNKLLYERFYNTNWKDLQNLISDYSESLGKNYAANEELLTTGTYLLNKDQNRQILIHMLYWDIVLVSGWVDKRLSSCIQHFINQMQSLRPKIVKEISRLERIDLTPSYTTQVKILVNKGFAHLSPFDKGEKKTLKHYNSFYQMLDLIYSGIIESMKLRELIMFIRDNGNAAEAKLLDPIKKRLDTYFDTIRVLDHWGWTPVQDTVSPYIKAVSNGIENDHEYLSVLFHDIWRK